MDLSELGLPVSADTEFMCDKETQTNLQHEVCVILAIRYSSKGKTALMI